MVISASFPHDRGAMMADSLGRQSQVSDENLPPVAERRRANVKTITERNAHNTTMTAQSIPGYSLLESYTQRRESRKDAEKELKLMGRAAFPCKAPIYVRVDSNRSQRHIFS